MVPRRKSKSYKSARCLSNFIGSSYQLSFFFSSIKNSFPVKSSIVLAFRTSKNSNMIHSSLLYLTWAITSLPLVYCIPLGGPEPLQLVAVVGAPTDDVSCPVRESKQKVPSLVKETDVFVYLALQPSTRSHCLGSSTVLLSDLIRYKPILHCWLRYW